MGKTTEFYRQLRSDLGQGPLAVNAARRLTASTIVKDGYTESSGARELERLTAYIKDHPAKVHLLGTKGDLKFYKSAGGPYGGLDIVCVVGEQAVGTVHLSNACVEIEDPDGSRRFLSCVQPSSFISLPYRGKGIVFGMYQWIISQYNLVADERQTRPSFNLWKRLAKMYPALILSQMPVRGRVYKVDPKAKLTLKTTLMLIMRHK